MHPLQSKEEEELTCRKSGLPLYVVAGLQNQNDNGEEEEQGKERNRERLQPLRSYVVMLSDTERNEEMVGRNRHCTLRPYHLIEGYYRMDHCKSSISFC